MPTPAQLRRAVPHIVHDVFTVRQAKAFRHNKFGWIAWYPMARNAAVFLEVFPGRGEDIHAREFFDRGTAEMKRWQEAKANLRTSAPPAVDRLYADASQAAVHLSWKRVTKPSVQVPSTRVTNHLLLLWNEFLKSVPATYRRRFLAEWRRLSRRK